MCVCDAATAEVRLICLRLLALVAVRCGPAELVLDAVAKKVGSRVFEQQLDATAELELQINALMTSLCFGSPTRGLSRESEVCVVLLEWLCASTPRLGPH